MCFEYRLRLNSVRINSVFRGAESYKSSSRARRDLLYGVLNVTVAWNKIVWIEREEMFRIMCIKVVIQGKR